MNSIVILKLTLVPALIAGITLAGRRWGAAVAGWLSAFPVVAAPILFFIATEQGPAFAASAAGATLSAVLAILVFALAYAWTAARHGWQLSLLAAFLAYAGAVTGLNLWSPSVPATAVAVLAALLAAPRLFPALPVKAMTVSRSSDLHWRMIAAALLVLSVTHFSTQLGPRLSGLFAMFPVMSSVLAVFSHRQQGAGFAVGLLRGTVLGYYAFAVFCIALSLGLPTLGVVPAFGLALGAAVLVQGASRLVMLRAGAAARA